MLSDPLPLFGEALADRSDSGVIAFIDRYASWTMCYGSGKVALRDGLANLVEFGESVLLPAYLPDAVSEPFRELGLEARYYAVEEHLAPDLADLETRIDDETTAVMSVDYFGFPTPGLAEFTALIDDYDCYHIDDSAHAPLSVDDGTLLGTRGHLGITSLWKLLPIPDGAVLYCNDDAVAEAYTPSNCAGVRDGVTGDDWQFVCNSIVFDVLDRNDRIRDAIDVILALSETVSVPGPNERYEAGKSRMSKLSSYVLDNADPQALRRDRRANYLAWRRLLDTRDGVELLYETLPPGICPQVVPVRAANPQRFREVLDRCGVPDVTTWPRLSPAVVEDPQYETATRLSQELLVLPVHRHVDPTTIETVGKRLR